MSLSLSRSTRRLVVMIALMLAGSGVALASPLRVAVYDAAPYGWRAADGTFVGASVDIWRRVAEERGWSYKLQLIGRMEDVLAGLQHGDFDAAIGAITITPERLARVDFSYPTHHSGVAAAFRKDTGVLAALGAYAVAAGQLGALMATMLALLLITGVLMWLFERRRGEGQGTAGQGTAGQGTAAHETAGHETAVGSLHEGLYWAIVTMTTVGYGDKTPKTHFGRALAVFWMLGSLALVSLLSTSIVAQVTADRVAGGDGVRASDLVGKRLAAVADSSGAEYLAGRKLVFARFPGLGDALDALVQRRVDAVVNSVGALEYAIANTYDGRVAMPNGLLAPAQMGIALPYNSPLRIDLDETIVRITTSPEWQRIEPSYYGR